MSERNMYTNVPYVDPNIPQANGSNPMPPLGSKQSPYVGGVEQCPLSLVSGRVPTFTVLPATTQQPSQLAQVIAKVVQGSQWPVSPVVHGK